MKVKKNNETPFPLKTPNHPLRQKTQNTRRKHAEYTENALKEMKVKRTMKHPSP